MVKNRRFDPRFSIPQAESFIEKEGASRTDLVEQLGFMSFMVCNYH